jgi:hypothetical protein
MFRLFFELTWWSVRNRFRKRLGRLREPRYMIGALFFVLWFVFVFFHPGARHKAPPSEYQLIMGGPELWRFGLALALLVLALGAVWWPGERRPLEFTPAEVQFLFTAPLTRRQLVRYKLLRSQGGLLLGAVVATIFLRPHTLRDGWTFSAGFWLGLTACRLFSIGVGLGAGALRRRWALLATSLVVAAILVVAAAPAAGEMARMEAFGQRLEALRQVWSGGAARVVLWPFLTLASLPFSGSPAAFGAGLPGVLLIVVACYAWVLRKDAAFEEAAAAHAAKPKLKPLEPRVSGRGRTAPFPLALAGRSETAILWKNLILLGRYASLRTLVLMLPFVFPFLMAAASGKSVTVSVIALTLSLTVSVTTVLVGPGMMRNDLRQDLRRLSILKSWPVSGAALVRGELLAPALVLSVVAWLAILVAAVALGYGKHGGRFAVLLPHRLSLAAAGVMIAPAIILAQLVVQNGFAVLLPAWMATGKSAGAGLERMGQGMFIIWGGWLSALVFLAPAASVALLVMHALGGRAHPGSVVAAAAVLLAVVVAEALPATAWLGRAFERSDLQSIDPAE